MGLPTVTTDGEQILLEVPGPSILKEDANAVLIAPGPMKRSGIKVVWKEGSSSNPRDGGYIQLRDGRRIAMDFHQDLWHLPILQQRDRQSGTVRTSKEGPATIVRQTTIQPARTKSVRHITSFANSTNLVSTNRYQVLATSTSSDTAGTPPGFSGSPIPKGPRHRKRSGWTETDLAEDHRAWCHPATSIRKELLKHYPSLFPHDSATRRHILEYRCPDCDLTKGARQYRKSLRVKKKEAARQQACRSGIHAIESDMPRAGARMRICHNCHRQTDT